MSFPRNVYNALYNMGYQSEEEADEWPVPPAAAMERMRPDEERPGYIPPAAAAIDRTRAEADWYYARTGRTLFPEQLPVSTMLFRRVGSFVSRPSTKTDPSILYDAVSLNFKNAVEDILSNDSTIPSSVLSNALNIAFNKKYMEIYNLISRYSVGRPILGRYINATLNQSLPYPRTLTKDVVPRLPYPRTLTEDVAPPRGSPPRRSDPKEFRNEKHLERRERAIRLANLQRQKSRQYEAMRRRQPLPLRPLIPERLPSVEMKD